MNPAPGNYPIRSRQFNHIRREQAWITTVVLACVLSGCTAAAPPTTSADHGCERFASPYEAVDPCSVEAVLTAAVTTLFSYRPSVDIERRAGFRAARPLMDPRFADRAEPAAQLWAPITPALWQQWRTTNTEIMTKAWITNDDHPADSPTAAGRVMAVELHPVGQPRFGWVVYARAGRADARAAWLLTGLEVAA